MDDAKFPDSGKTPPYNGDLRELVLEDWDRPFDATTPIMRFCPFHEDEHRPSLAVYADHAYCYTCHKHVGRREFSSHFSTSMDQTAAKILAGGLKRTYTPKPKVDPVALAMASHRLLLKNDGKQEWLFARGLNFYTLEEYQLGHNGLAYTLPVFRGGEVVAVRFRRDDAETIDGPKYWGISGDNGIMWYPHPPLTLYPTLVMTEGEFDALLLRQEGLPAFSLTNGDQAWRKVDWRSTTIRRLILCRDQDVAGRKATEEFCLHLQQEAPHIEVVNKSWPSGGKDVTELWQHGAAIYDAVVHDLRTLVEETAYASVG